MSNTVLSPPSPETRGQYQQNNLKNNFIPNPTVYQIYPILYDHTYNLPTFEYVNNAPLPAPAIQIASSKIVESHNYKLPSESPAQVQYEKFKDHKKRLLTYETWERKKSEASCLNRAGFFYTGNGDKVRCFTCGVSLQEFAEDIEPIVEHMRHYDKCRYLLLLLGEADLEKGKAWLRVHDRKYRIKSQTLETRRKIRHPDYQTLTSRKLSFARWPLKLNVTSVADSGLYYTGYETVVCCFACDLRFQQLKSVEEIWLDHCYLNPMCPYMESRVGARFIRLVQETVNDIKAEEDGDFGGQSKEIVSYMEMTFKTTCVKDGFEAIDINPVLDIIISKGNGDNIGPMLDVLENHRQKDSPLHLKLKDKLPGYLQEENLKMKKIVCCKICEGHINALILPCRHHDFCMDCLQKVKNCPKCYRPITETVKTYL